NWLDRLRYEIKYYLWDRPTGPVLFNNQDAAMVAATTKYYKRSNNMRYLTRIAPCDQTHTMWRQYCDENARGVGNAYQKTRVAAVEQAERIAAQQETALSAGPAE